MRAGPLSRWAVRVLTRPRPLDPLSRGAAWDPWTLGPVMRAGDVLLVEGDQRISQVISYLTTSTWSHAALYLGAGAPQECVARALERGEDADHLLVEANAEEGVVCVPLSKYRRQRVRICRPGALRPDDARALLAFAVGQIGKRYDVDNILDLARYFLPAGLVPRRLRRDALFFGAGKPTEVMCSSLIAEAFQRVGYPILPLSARRERRSLASRIARRILGTGARHLRFRRIPTTLVVPRDFDLSPYFDVVKPPAPEAARYRELDWESHG